MVTNNSNALVAQEISGGNYISLWVRYGDPKLLGQALKKHFKTSVDVSSLISERSVTAVEGPKTGFQGELTRNNGTYRKPIGKGSVLVNKEKGDGVQKAGIPGTYGGFSSLEELLNSDVQYVYVFSNGKWKTYQG